MVWWFVSQNVMIVFFCPAARFENRGGLMSALGQVGRVGLCLLGIYQSPVFPK